MPTTIFPSVSIDQLPEDAAQWDCPTLLDLNAQTPLTRWLDSNPNFAERLIDQRWRIGILEEQIETLPNSSAVRERLEQNMVEILEYHFESLDKPLIDEIQRAYFGNDASSLFSAQLLAYGRRHNGDTGKVRVISRHRAFQSIPDLQHYFLPDATEVGQEDDATMLRLLRSMDIHPQIQRAAYERIINHDYPIAVDQAVKILIDEIRDIGRTNGLLFASQINDRPMVKTALCINPGPPQIRLNNYVTASEKNEQDGYHYLIEGIVAAVRNPLAHAPADLPFLQNRFGKRHTALKFLCLLSWLFEKLENRTYPPPV